MVVVGEANEERVAGARVFGISGGVVDEKRLSGGSRRGKEDGWLAWRVKTCVWCSRCLGFVDGKKWCESGRYGVRRRLVSVPCAWSWACKCVTGVGYRCAGCLELGM